jgi:uncharacterized membrane protein
MPTDSELRPGVGSAYNYAWRTLWPSFWMLLLVAIISGAIGMIPTPFQSIGDAVWPSLLGEVGRWSPAIIIAAIMGISLSVFVGVAFAVFVEGPVGFGVSFAYLKAARKEKLDIADMFAAFKNYWQAVLASFLVGLIIFVGFILLIVPGIYLACKLAFTPYLVVDRKMGATDAMRESWRMTRGHGWTIFLIGLLAIPIAILGLLCLIIGVVISIMWITLAYASLYHAVESAKGGPATQYLAA